MKKRNIIIITIIVVLISGLLFLSTGKARTDVFLRDFSIDERSNIMTIKVGVSSSSGYVRKMKRTSGSMNYYYTFYSTFGINSKIGAKDTFEIQLDNNVDAIYFYTGYGGYKKVLTKDNETNKWSKVANFTSDTMEIISSGQCDASVKLYYSENESNIYTYCLDNIKVGAKQEELKDYLLEKNLPLHAVMQNLVNDLINEGVFIKGEESVMNDGGSIMYLNNNINILMCNTLSGNKDIYIGDGTMKYNNGFCK